MHLFSVRVQYTYSVYVCSTPIQCTCAVHLFSVCVHNIYSVYVCSTSVQCTCALHLFSVRVQYIYLVYVCSTFFQCTLIPCHGQTVSFKYCFKCVFLQKNHPFQSEVFDVLKMWRSLSTFAFKCLPTAFLQHIKFVNLNQQRDSSSSSFGIPLLFPLFCPVPHFTFDIFFGLSGH